MLPSPLKIRCEAQYTHEAPDKVIGGRRFEKRVVPAIMEQNEQANHESSGQNREGQREPNGNLLQKVHRTPQSHERNQGVEYLPAAAPIGRALVLRYDLLPDRWIALGSTNRNNRFAHKNFSCGLPNRGQALEGTARAWTDSHYRNGETNLFAKDAQGKQKGVWDLTVQDGILLEGPSCYIGKEKWIWLKISFRAPLDLMADYFQRQ